MKNLKLKDFLNYKFISRLELSPNNDNAGFVVTLSDYDNNTYNSNIWLLNRKSKKYKKLTCLNKENSFLWLDNDTILFPSQRDEHLKAKTEAGEAWTVYYAIDINGGEADEYMRIPLNVSELQKVDNNNFILTAEFDNNLIDLHNLKGEEREKAAAKIKDDKDYEVLDEIPFWSNGQGFTNKKRNRLYLFNKETNKLTPISDELSEIYTFKYKNGKIVYTANKFEGKMDLFDSLNVYDIKQNINTVLIPQSTYSIGYVDFIEDLIVLTLSDMKTGGLNQNQDIYKFENGKLELITVHNTGFGSSVGSDCRYGGGKQVRVINDKIYFVSTLGKCSFINELSLNGDLKIITEDTGSVDCFDVFDDEILFVGMRNYKLQEIYSLTNEEKQITDFNEPIINNKTISIPEYMKFFNNDGIELEGFVIKPVDYDENKIYPAIFDIHGGPKTVYGEVFYHEMQVWANMGYFVFFCNPHGSDGRGDEFADIRGKYGTIDYDDLMKFTDLVLQAYPQIDKKRVGVTGGSYGGYMTNWIIGHTDRFKCAVSQRSIANWISKFGTTDIGYYFNADQNASTPWENHDKLWWHSPLKYADKAVTPTLFIHSQQDYRCWLAEGLQMFTALKYHGVEARLCMFKGENHELSRGGKPKHRVRRLEEMTNWFEKYLR
ncbi:S9 family peptidase [Sedimentibacter sp. zth1]|uniref:alpha/beta hydrolase family protein n=1 Tax=Sedimentibacter sp. zth1 TaxID=2816908 RepID=UPI001A936FC7|nr:S9 family peptidase [Sedimentibacter sp. zth1]QSX05017.1 S9 family peptidase [Sedimentibacter sp. zth1]